MPVPVDEAMKMALLQARIALDARAWQWVAFEQGEKALIQVRQARGAHQVFGGHHRALARMAHPIAAAAQ